MSPDSCPCVLVCCSTCSPAVAKPLFLFCQELDVLFVFLTQLHCHIFSFCLFACCLLTKIECTIVTFTEIYEYFSAGDTPKVRIKKVAFKMYLPH